ncbi:MAG: DciA family protein [candidate division WOR-3 bacterium]|nr:DciA family protein [candidate division WOR-3 bacterium]
MNEPNHISENLERIRELVDKKYRSSLSLQDIDLTSVVPEDLLKSCSLRSITGNKLIIAADSSVNLFRLNMLRDKILIKIKNDYPDIRVDDLKLIISTEE